MTRTTRRLATLTAVFIGSLVMAVNGYDSMPLVAAGIVAARGL